MYNAIVMEKINDKAQKLKMKFVIGQILKKIVVHGTDAGPSSIIRSAQRA
jgi:hypothetical protein